MQSCGGYVFFKVHFLKCFYPKCIFAKCTRLACLLSFASFFLQISPVFKFQKNIFTVTFFLQISTRFQIPKYNTATFSDFTRFQIPKYNTAALNHNNTIHPSQLCSKQRTKQTQPSTNNAVAYVLV